MRTLVVGDVHGCADELATLIHEADAERIVLVGDLFTKGPDPAGVWALIREHRCEATVGNHDARLIAWIDGRRPNDRGAKKCVEVLDRVDPSWQSWVRALPSFLDAAPFVVVHAMLHPTEGVAGTTRSMALSWRRWPDDLPDAPHWWRLYEHAQPVIYGHDAVQGLVRRERDGKPYVLGLDSGCVYGRELTGYLVDEDRQIHVRSRHVYRAIGV